MQKADDVISPQAYMMVMPYDWLRSIGLCKISSRQGHVVKGYASKLVEAMWLYLALDLDVVLNELDVSCYNMVPAAKQVLGESTSAISNCPAGSFSSSMCSPCNPCSQRSLFHTIRNLQHARGVVCCTDEGVADIGAFSLKETERRERKFTG